MNTTPEMLSPLDRFGSTRRHFLRRSALAGAGMAIGLVGKANQNADQPPESEIRAAITPDAQRAIDNGLAFLNRRQAADGAFGEGRTYHGSVAITSLAGLAFMAGGHQPGRGTYGTNVLRAVQYVLSRERRDNPAGFLHYNPSATPQQQVGMYDHGFGTMFLAEVFGMIPDLAVQDRVKGTIERAVRLIELSQNRDGGWRYEPKPPHLADISVTVCQIMALRAARNAGFDVNRQIVNRCIKYVRSCQNPDGGYSYQSGQTRSAFALSAAGLVALYAAGIYEGLEIDRTLRYLNHFRPNPRAAFREIQDQHWFYGQYYAAQAMWTSAIRNPNNWNQWFPAIRDELVARSRNRTDGAWSDQICNHYATAMACIILQIPNNYLPILQK